MAEPFSMAKILDWRIDLEETARLTVTQLQARLRLENQQLQSLITENIKVKNEHIHSKQIHSLRYNDYYKNVITEQIIQQKNQIDSTLADIQSAQKNLVQTYSDRKIMDKLKEKELTTYYQNERRREQMELDDIATMNYKRRVF
ncbi:hypothetical protein BW727_101875 [Jeotgalibaca dankookensis]|uniref:Flagellar FliJ protein n=1 Tax=Jeotgalibaca dankookensis TaxID=708126 RepID=A0A1S6IRP6_9LACT|nr:flagellar export protein FliJ [Jeotgalibaca dankookensis]AQS54199.1 hypothetical protein BW727_101875 [Jeotgalibaca dankookensis]